MECRFTYSAREYRRSIASYHRLNLTKNVVLCILFWVFFTVIFGNTDSDDTAPDILPAYWFPICFTLFYFTPIWGFMSSLFFRRNPLYNQPMVYVLEDAGFTLHTPVMVQNVAWVAIGKAGETSSGFLLFWGKSKRQFHWIPKNGFSSEDDIIGCRNLIMKSVRQYKQVRTRRSLVSRVARAPARRSTL